MNEVELVQKCKAIYREVIELEKEHASLSEQAADLKKHIKDREAEVRRLIIEAELAQMNLPLTAPALTADPDADPACPLCDGTGRVWDGPEEDQVQIECACIGEMRAAREGKPDEAVTS